MSDLYYVSSYLSDYLVIRVVYLMIRHPNLFLSYKYTRSAFSIAVVVFANSKLILYAIREPSI